jgi:hypothetical protein
VDDEQRDTNCHLQQAGLEIIGRCGADAVVDAVDGQPYDPDTLAQLGWRLAVRGDREGLEYLQQAVARSANPPGWYYHLIAV